MPRRTTATTKRQQHSKRCACRYCRTRRAKTTTAGRYA